MTDGNDARGRLVDFIADEFFSVAIDCSDGAEAFLNKLVTEHRADLAEAAGLYTRDAKVEQQVRSFQDGYRAGQRETAEKIEEAIHVEADQRVGGEVDGLRMAADIARSFAKEGK